jgi:hypothetical protein
MLSKKKADSLKTIDLGQLAKRYFYSMSRELSEADVLCNFPNLLGGAILFLCGLFWGMESEC